MTREKTGGARKLDCRATERGKLRAAVREPDSVLRGVCAPMDICVISERPVDRAEVILAAHVIGGLQMIDSGLADDKIIAVLEKDAVWGNLRDINDLPKALVERLRHYFLTYKLIPGSEAHVHIDLVYGFEHATKVIQAAIEDYQEAFGKMDEDGKDIA